MHEVYQRQLRRAMRFVRANAAEPKLPLAERYPQHSIGRHTYGPLNIRDDGDPAHVTVGSFTSIASGVTVFTGGEHRPDWVTTFPFPVLWDEAKGVSGHPASRGDVVIGNDVWLGADAMVMSGVTIGDGAVIGARTVVRKDVPPYAIVAGNPARTIRTRFDDRVVPRLMAIRWWDWADSKIVVAMPYLLSSNIEDFLIRAEAGDFDD